MGRGATAAPAIVSSLPSSSGAAASTRRFIGRIRLTRVPYHRLDEIHEEEEEIDESVELFKSYIEEEEDQSQGQDQDQQEHEQDRKHQHRQIPSTRSRKKKMMFDRSVSSSGIRFSWRTPLRTGHTVSARARRNRWRRMRLRICSRVRWSWLSPLELLKKLRKAYIQAMISLSAKESQCGVVMLGSPWSFPVVVPFRSGVC